LATLHINDTAYQVDLSLPLDISIGLSDKQKPGVSAFGASRPEFVPVVAGDFIGSVKDGGPVNFKNVAFNPHGNGTHTECVGHITDIDITINQALKHFHFLALLITLDPESANGDKIP